jgi:hypothetical protein
MQRTACAESQLQPMLKDRFTANGMCIAFSRDSKGAVSGYGIWFDWEWNVRFSRHDPQ